MHPSPSAIGATALGLITAAAAGLNAPRWVWIATLAAGVILAVWALIPSQRRLRWRLGVAHLIGPTEEAPPRPPELQQEVDLARRTIRVARRVHKAHHEAMARHDEACKQAKERGDLETRQLSLYNRELFHVKSHVGSQWHELLTDLHANGLIDNVQMMRFQITVNMTGLDSSAVAVEAIGRQLLRGRGIDPDA